MPKFVTTEGLFAASGALWLLLSSFLPQIPAAIPLGIPVPGFTEITITPGLLIGVAVIPVVIKALTPGKVPFVSSETPPKEAP